MQCSKDPLLGGGGGGGGVDSRSRLVPTAVASLVRLAGSGCDAGGWGQFYRTCPLISVSYPSWQGDCQKVLAVCVCVCVCVCV